MQYGTCKNSIEIEFQVGPEWITATVQDTAQLKQFLCVIYNMQLIEGVIPSILKKSIVQKHSIHVIHRHFGAYLLPTPHEGIIIVIKGRFQKKLTEFSIRGPDPPSQHP